MLCLPCSVLKDGPSEPVPASRGILENCLCKQVCLMSGLGKERYISQHFPLSAHILKKPKFDSICGPLSLHALCSDVSLNPLPNTAEQGAVKSTGPEVSLLGPEPKPTADS